MTIANVIKELDGEIARLPEARKLLVNATRLTLNACPAANIRTATDQDHLKKRKLSAEAR